jgi:hypothetical protein
LLGHVHAARSFAEPGGANFIYPGSPQALDRGETGSHGVWLIEEIGKGVSWRPIPISSVRYVGVEMPVDGIERVDDVDTRLYGAVRAAIANLEETEHLRCVRCRVQVTGRTGLQRDVEARLNELAGDLDLSTGEAGVSIESIQMDTKQAHDLEALRVGVGAPAVLARLLGDPELDATLSNELSHVIAEIEGSRSFMEVSGGAEELEELDQFGRHELRRMASVLLDELLRQKAEAS